MGDDKSIYTTDGTNVLCSLADEKADTHLFPHASDAVRKGLSVKIVDTDIVILVIFTLNEINPDELWLALELDLILGICLSMRLLVTWILEFVLLFQCYMHLQDAILSQHFVAEPAWNIWRVYPEVIKAFEEFLLMQTETSDMAMETME